MARGPGPEGRFAQPLERMLLISDRVRKKEMFW